MVDTKNNKKVLSPDSRWRDINAVIDRFNSPELFDFYINSNIAYAISIPASENMWLRSNLTIG